MSFLGIPLTIRLPGRETNGALSIVELNDHPGGIAPQHIHQREDETFLILEGEYEFDVGGEVFLAAAGATVFGPRGIPHGYRYLGNTPGRILLLITPAGVERWFEEINALSPDKRPDLPHILEMGRHYGLEFLPPQK